MDRFDFGVLWSIFPSQQIGVCLCSGSQLLRTSDGVDFGILLMFLLNTTSIIITVSNVSRTVFPFRNLVVFMCSFRSMNKHKTFNDSSRAKAG